jgi:hypothetical protein
MILIIVGIIIVIVLIYNIFISPCSKGSSLNGTGLNTLQIVRGRPCKCKDNTLYPTEFGCIKCNHGTVTDGKGGMSNKYCKCPLPTEYYHFANVNCMPCMPETHANGVIGESAIWSCNCNDPTKKWNIEQNKCV